MDKGNALPHQGPGPLGILNAGSSHNGVGMKIENNKACAESAFLCVSAQHFSCCPELSLKKISGKGGNDPVLKIVKI